MRVQLFECIMLMTFYNLAIVQHCHTLRYTTIRGRGYQPRLQKLMPGDYVYLQQTAPTTLDVSIG